MIAVLFILVLILLAEHWASANAIDELARRLDALEKKKDVDIKAETPIMR